MRFRTKEKWPVDRIERLKQLWSRGITPKTIAEEFNTTVGAVETMAAHLQLAEQPAFRSLAHREPLGRHDDGCSWPVEKDGRVTQFCGADSKKGKPYCEDHLSRAYLKRSRSNAAAVAI